MKPVHCSMIQDRSSRVLNHILKRGPRRRLFASVLTCIPILLFVPAITHKAEAGLTILHSFGDGSVPNDGAHPTEGLVQAPNGDFFGVTIDQAQQLNRAAGTIFRMTAAGKVSIIYRFGLTSNMWVSGPLVYYQQQLVGIVSGSAVFALASSSRGWQFSFWHIFTGAPKDGAGAVGGLTLGLGDTLFGVTAFGGTHNAGTAYKFNFTANRPYSIVYDLPTNVGSLSAGLVLANDGNFYGSTSGFQLFGPTVSIFRLTPQGQFTTVWSDFLPATQAPLMQASNGDFFTTIPLYNSHDGSVLTILGTIFEGFPIHNFTGLDGLNPVGTLVQGPNGNLYGATSGGGAAFAGTIYEMSIDGSLFKVVHSFGDGSVPHDGIGPNEGLIVGKDGNLYGTTYYGGSAGLGTIFKMTP